MEIVAAGDSIVFVVVVLTICYGTFFFSTWNITKSLNYLVLFFKKFKMTLIIIILSKLQVLFFMFVPNFRCCSLPLKLMSFVLNVSESCTLCPLRQT
ncbi:hypothetical protein Hanom_Chr07g00674201 [Helianthus anomalus]